MSAITMTIEGVRTRAGTSEVLLTLAVPMEQAALLSGFLPRIGEQIGVAFADVSGKPVVEKAEKETGWNKLAPLTQSAVMMCQDEDFQRFVVEQNDHGNELPTEAGARSFVLDWCKVKTRKDLGTVDGAKERFGTLMARYREWLNKRK